MLQLFISIWVRKFKQAHITAFSIPRMLLKSFQLSQCNLLSSIFDNHPMIQTKVKYLLTWEEICRRYMKISSSSPRSYSSMTPTNTCHMQFLNHCNILCVCVCGDPCQLEGSDYLDKRQGPSQAALPLVSTTSSPLLNPTQTVLETGIPEHIGFFQKNQKVLNPKP